LQFGFCNNAKRTKQDLKDVEESIKGLFENNDVGFFLEMNVIM